MMVVINSSQIAHVLASAVGGLLGAESGRRYFRVRGGDADPDTVLGMPSIATCFAREARRWTHHLSPEDPSPIMNCVELTCDLAAANAACNHRKVSHRAIATLSAVMSLALDSSIPMHPALRAVMSERGSTMVQALIITLFSLNSSALVPKIVNLMSETALLAVLLSGSAGSSSAGELPAPGQCPSDDVICSTAVQILQFWIVRARTSLDAARILPAQTIDAFIAEWDWNAVVKQAVSLRHQDAMQNGQGRENLEIERMQKRTNQRVVRLLAEAARRSGAALLN